MSIISRNKNYTRKHLIPPSVKNKIRLMYASRYLNLIEPKLEGESVLIVGAGSSAEPGKVATISKGYDITITINSALFVLPSATFHSFEFATQDSEMCSQMIEWLDAKKVNQLIVKPHCIWPMSKANLSALKVKQDSMSKEISEDENVDVISRPLLNGLFQYNYPGYKDVDGYMHLVKRKRPLYQWNGSLSVWLDLVHRSSGIKKLGLIGTDFGGGYSTAAKWYSSSAVSNNHLLQTDRSETGGPLPFLTVLSYLCGNGYLDNVDVEHYHYNDQLKAIINN